MNHRERSVWDLVEAVSILIYARVSRRSSEGIRAPDADGSLARSEGSRMRGDRCVSGSLTPTPSGSSEV